MSLSRRATNPSAIEQIIADRVGLGRSGVANVSRPTAMRHSAAWAALRLRADLISTMPVDTSRKVDGVQVEDALPSGAGQSGGEIWWASSSAVLDAVRP